MTEENISTLKLEGRVKGPLRLIYSWFILAKVIWRGGVLLIIEKIRLLSSSYLLAILYLPI